MNAILKLDGSHGEGGGQILRTALALSAHSGTPLHMVNIRAGRKNPGLAPQHLAGVLAVAQLCDAQLQGVELRSQEIHFTPRCAVEAGAYTFDISRLSGQSSAGAVTLLLQAILLPLALTPGESYLLLRGGTHVAWSPPLHYVHWVLLPALARMGLKVEIDLDDWGWYPRGGGQIMVRISGQPALTGLALNERGNLTEIKGLAVASNLAAHIPQRISNRANNVLRTSFLPAGVQPLRTGGPSTGAGLFLAAVYENSIAGFSSLGKQGKPSEAVADEATEALIAFHRERHALDPYLPDQLLPFMALAEGASELSTIAITPHTLTNVDTLQHFVDREFVVRGEIGQAGTIEVH